tara:strand:- start:1082 stop:1516 length:435 start_codon:yes stop_codon:yes gene_type:complete
MRADYLNENSGKSNLDAKVVNLTAAATLTADQSGSCFFLDSAGGAYEITLPSVGIGLQYKLFVVEDTPTGAITIAAGSAIMYGRVLEGEVDTTEDANGSAGATGKSNFIIGTGASQGDWMSLVSDGISWYVSGVSALDNSITAS